MNIALYHIDAFTDTIFQGNPAAVVVLDTDHVVTEQHMQQIATENNLSETAFISQQDTVFSIRYFTPTTEVAFCGHATLSAAHVIFAHLGYTGEKISFKTFAGVSLFVHQQNGRYCIDAPLDNLEEKQALLTSYQSFFDNHVIAVYQGNYDMLIVLNSSEYLQQYTYNKEHISSIPTRGVILTAHGKETDIITRCFYPNIGIDEDPVTGSAHSSLLSYWRDILRKETISSYQASPRGGYIRGKVQGDRCQIFGNAVTYSIGTIV